MWKHFLETFRYDLAGFVQHFNGVPKQVLDLSALNARELFYVLFYERERELFQLLFRPKYVNG